MTKMTGFLKGLASLAAIGVGYMDKNYSPLIWVLLALVAFDLIANARDEGVHLKKFGSAALAMGFPSYIASHYGLPDFGKYIVVMLVVVYVQIVCPQLVTLIGKIKFSADKATQAADEAIAKTALDALESKVEALAQKVDPQAAAAAQTMAAKVTQPTTGTSTQEG